jgi:putative protease
VQLSKLELLAPARNKEIGIAAIDCGADSLYIAGPSFGAREAAGNPMHDIEKLTSYGRKYGAKVFMVINTILYDKEIKEAERLARQAYEAGCSALIIQDLGLLKASMPPIPLFASTQTNIRTVEQAKMLEELGFSRLILARELSLAQIKEIRANTSVELESFIHGALCVSYSGQCYMSERLTGRSANRGACAQACRSKYDLTDSKGKLLVRDKTLLSLKDLNLGDYIPQLAEAGISSFKVEGRLKNISYIKNVIRYYRSLIDTFIESDGRYTPASYGKLYGGFTPRPESTFNRGYTNLFINGRRGDWNSGDAAKSIGEFVGTVKSSTIDKRGGKTNIRYHAALRIENGDGICFIGKGGEVLGSRANVTEPGLVIINDKIELEQGVKIYRNFNHNFEREMEKNMPKRLLSVTLDLTYSGDEIVIEALCEDGTAAKVIEAGPFEEAKNPEAAERSLRTQLEKSTDIYVFRVNSLGGGELPFLPISAINDLRRRVAADLASAAELPETGGVSRVVPESASGREIPENISGIFSSKKISYLGNVSNRLSEQLYRELGAESVDKAFEIDPPAEAELMRCKYCIKFELGMCPKEGYSKPVAEPLFLVNGQRKFRLAFDCKNCEMVIFG